MLRTNAHIGGMLYYDGQFDDARLNLSITLTATEYGATIINHVAVTDLIKEHGRIVGTMVRGASEEGEWEIRAASVINATGPFSDQIRTLNDPQAPPMLQVSLGAHIVLDERFSSPETGLLIPKTEDGRVLFILPWLGHTLIGTTDVSAETTHKPPVREQEIEYLLRHARRYLADPVSVEDVRSAWAEHLAKLANDGLDMRLAAGHPYIEAEVVWAARVEFATTPLDVLARRTRIATLDRAAAIEALPRVVDLLADELLWDADHRASEQGQALNRLEHVI